jgi:hypothetical protein
MDTYIIASEVKHPIVNMTTKIVGSPSGSLPSGGDFGRFGRFGRATWSAVKPQKCMV